jgi:Sulfatase-modifying factor enzyme 1/Novel STAND NTPase 1
VQARLLTAEGEGAEAQVSVAHERLFDAWPSLARWVAAHQEDLRLLRQAELDAAEWARQGYDLVHPWHPKRLKRLQRVINALPPERAGAGVREFARPQPRMLERVAKGAMSHEERRTVGNYLAEFDPRPGAGVGPDGTPDIDWVPIPGGKVVLERSAGKAEVAPFEMARYPVTNDQFQAFAAAEGGYRNPRWWRDMPDRANDGPAESRWPEASHPRVEVSWYEAVAFCRWLPHRLGFEVRLLTEFEWQQAATGGDPKNVYPWGREWDAARCNSGEGGLNRTTAVGLYPAGASVQGVLDLAGNVWEWCLNKCLKPTDAGMDRSGQPRALCGSSWDDYFFSVTSPAAPTSPSAAATASGFVWFVPHRPNH